MEISFNHTFWGLIILASLLLATGITALLYYRAPENKELSKVQRITLITLRFLSLFFIALLFTGPLIKTLRKIDQSPVVLLAVDNSSSMTGLDGDTKKEEISGIISNLTSGLKKKFNVVTYTFGDKTERTNSHDFSEKRSDYSQMLKVLYENHFNQNVGAMIIVGDGNYNQGENPANTVKRINFPVYSLGIGDTSRIRDARIADIRVNKTAFTGNKFPVEADIRINGFTGKNLLVSVSRAGLTEWSKVVHADLDEYFTTLPFSLDAVQSGLQYYTASIEVVDGEQNKSNNSWQFVIQILDNKQKILVISNGSHPDAGALKNALEQQINYEVTLVSQPPLPENFADYNLVVLNQFPSSSWSVASFFESTVNKRVPYLVITGAQTFLPQLNLLKSGVEIVPRAGGFEEAQSAVNEQFGAFTLSDGLKDNMTNYPPLKVPFGEYNLESGLQVLAYQRIKNIVTGLPLIAVGNLSGRKAGFILGEGIWRWRLRNYQLSNNHEAFDEFMDKLVQYLALKDNEDNFIIDYKRVYNETEGIEMTAEVYNDAFELINTPEVAITVSDSTNREFNFVFDKGNGFYRLDAGSFPPGKYRFEAHTAIGTTDYSESGSFAVMPVNLEQLDFQAKHQVLYQLGFETNGEFFRPDETGRLIETVLSNKSIRNINYFESVLHEIINLKEVFFILLLLLSLEWFLRKFWGLY